MDTSTVLADEEEEEDESYAGLTEKVSSKKNRGCDGVKKIKK